MIGSRSIIKSIYSIDYKGNPGITLENESPFLTNFKVKGRKKKIKIMSNTNLTPITITSNKKYENNFLILDYSKSYKASVKLDVLLVSDNITYHNSAIYNNRCYSYKIEEISKGKFVVSFGDNYELKFFVNYNEDKKRLEIEDMKYSDVDNFGELFKMLILLLDRYTIFYSIFKQNYDIYETDCKDLSYVLDVIKKESDVDKVHFDVRNIIQSDDLIDIHIEVYIKTSDISYAIPVRLGIYKGKYVIIYNAPASSICGVLLFKLGGSKLWYINSNGFKLYSDGDNLYLNNLVFKIDGEDLKIEKLDDYVRYYKIENSTELCYDLCITTHIIGTNYFNIPLNLLIVDFYYYENLYLNTIIYSYELSVHKFSVAFNRGENGTKPMFNYVTNTLTQKLKYE